MSDKMPSLSHRYTHSGQLNVWEKCGMKSFAQSTIYHLVHELKSQSYHPESNTTNTKPCTSTSNAPFKALVETSDYDGRHSSKVALN